MIDNAELARNPIWRHSIDASRAINGANGPPYEGVVLLVASCFFYRFSVRKSLRESNLWMRHSAALKRQDPLLQKSPPRWIAFIA